MGFLKNLLNRSPTKQTVKMVEMNGNTFQLWNGKVYESDLVLACLRPYVNAVGKLHAIQIQNKSNSGNNVEFPYIRKLLDNPNPYMTGQELQEAVAISMKLNNNAFIRIIRDSNGVPCELVYIPCMSAEAIYQGLELYIRFNLTNGSMLTLNYNDIIHLKNNQLNGELFGQDNSEALNNLLNVLSMTDQSICKAIKNGGVIRWLLKFKSVMRPEQIEKRTQDFANSFMNVTNSTGVAGVDVQTDAIQVSPNDFVPNSTHSEKLIQRVFSFFGTNINIIQSNYNEDQWAAYYESEIEPIAIKLSNAYTNKLFTDGQIKFNNRIIFDSVNLQYASMNSKLQLSNMVDRGAMTVNEWRRVMNLPTLEGCDILVRRLDTAKIGEGGVQVEGD